MKALRYSHSISIYIEIPSIFLLSRLNSNGALIDNNLLWLNATVVKCVVCLTFEFECSCVCECRELFTDTAWLCCLDFYQAPLTHYSSVCGGGMAASATTDQANRGENTIKYHINSWSSLELSTHAELEVVLPSPNMFKMQNHDEIVKSRFAIKYFMTMDLLSHRSV